MRVLAESTCYWMLQADRDRRILLVVCASVGLDDLTIMGNTDASPSGANDQPGVDHPAGSFKHVPEPLLRRHHPELLKSDAALSLPVGASLKCLPAEWTLLIARPARLLAQFESASPP